MNQPTELQHARFWRDGWGRKYDQAEAQDQITERMERGEVRAALRWGKAICGQWRGKLNTSREASGCQAECQAMSAPQ
jgi:hypothetical protein